MTKFRVYSLDVWGHGPDECAKYDCPGGDRCAGYCVNDRASAGTVEIDLDAENPGIVAALVAEAFLTPDCDDKTIETDGDPEFMIEINRKSDGRYLLQLEPVDAS